MNFKFINNNNGQRVFSSSLFNNFIAYTYAHIASVCMHEDFYFNVRTFYLSVHYILDILIYI